MLLSHTTFTSATLYLPKLLLVFVGRGFISSQYRNPLQDTFFPHVCVESQHSMPFKLFSEKFLNAPNWLTRDIQ